MGTLVSRERYCEGLSGMLAVRIVLDPSERLELCLSNTATRAADELAFSYIDISYCKLTVNCSRSPKSPSVTNYSEAVLKQSFFLATQRLWLLGHNSKHINLSSIL